MTHSRAARMRACWPRVLAPHNALQPRGEGREAGALLRPLRPASAHDPGVGAPGRLVDAPAAAHVRRHHLVARRRAPRARPRPLCAPRAPPPAAAAAPAAAHTDRRGPRARRGPPRAPAPRGARSRSRCRGHAEVPSRARPLPLRGFQAARFPSAQRLAQAAVRRAVATREQRPNALRQARRGGDGGALKHDDAVLAVVRDEDVARPVHRHAGRVRQPEPLPCRPKVRTATPAAEKTTTRWLQLSATTSLPAPSAATPHCLCSSPAPPYFPKFLSGGVARHGTFVANVQKLSGPDVTVTNVMSHLFPRFAGLTAHRRGGRGVGATSGRAEPWVLCSASQQWRWSWPCWRSRASMAVTRAPVRSVGAGPVEAAALLNVTAAA
jgi:hypothetical protein